MSGILCRTSVPRIDEMSEDLIFAHHSNEHCGRLDLESLPEALDCLSPWIIVVVALRLYHHDPKALIALTACTHSLAKHSRRQSCFRTFTCWIHTSWIRISSSLSFLVARHCQTSIGTLNPEHSDSVLEQPHPCRHFLISRLVEC